jgi:hypothetical protein
LHDDFNAVGGDLKKTDITDSHRHALKVANKLGVPVTLDDKV